MTRTRYRFGDDHYPHFITNTVVAWLPVFSYPAFAEVVLDSWQFLHRERDIDILAFVDDPVHWRYSSARCYAGQAGLIGVCVDWR